MQISTQLICNQNYNQNQLSTSEQKIQYIANDHFMLKVTYYMKPYSLLEWQHEFQPYFKNNVTLINNWFKSF